MWVSLSYGEIGMKQKSQTFTIRIRVAPDHSPEFQSQMLVEAMKSYLPMLESMLKLGNTPQALDRVNRYFVKQIFNVVFYEDKS